MGFEIISPTYGIHQVNIDDEDMKRVSIFKWRVFKRKFGGFYVVSWTPMVNKQRKVIRLHNLIMNSLYIDHINGDGLDNRKENLRQSTATTNNQNKRKSRGESEYKGVYRNHQVFTKITWMACIQANGKHIHLGSFDSEEKAAKAYNEAALKYFKEFAKINDLTGSNISDI